MKGIELQLIQWLRSRLESSVLLGANRPSDFSDGQMGAAPTLGIGDDMAIVASAWGRTLIASDMLLDGVHFDACQHSMEQIGRKAMACNLSDCAAMAVQPLVATVSIALPLTASLADAQALFEGMLAAAEPYGLSIVGGDTTSWDHPLVIDVAIVAEPYPGVEPVLRSGARPGDGIYVTGLLGGSLLARHMTFEPRVNEARALAQSLGRRLHAMMDISDGLSIDLWRLCEASRVGAILEERLLQTVVSDAAHQVSQSDGRSALEHALTDGEDFELLLAVDGESAAACVPLFRIGEITNTGLVMIHEHGGESPIKPEGFVH